MPATVVFVHAHPDDEALLTAGTMARLAAQGHRVVLVVATDGAAGLTAATSVGEQTLASIRAEELGKSAAALGVADVRWLGYGDSGLDGTGTPSTPGLTRSAAQPFAQVVVATAAEHLAKVLQELGADVVVGYDLAGGYGHPDHVQVHRVVRAARDLAGTQLLLEATLPREPMARLVGAGYAMRRVIPPLGGLDVAGWRAAYTPRAQITHRIDVRPFLPAKRASLRAHASQASADGGPRTLDALLKLPRPAFRKVLGHEFFVGPHPPTGQRYYTDPLATLVLGPAQPPR